MPYKNPRRGRRRLRRGLRLTVLWVSLQLRCPKVSKGRTESPLVRLWAHTPCLGWSMTRRLRRGWSGCRPEGAVLSFEAKESTKESPRHGDSRGGPPRCALFANIGVPGTAVPGAQACQSLTVYGSCAHWARAPSRPKLRSAVAERLDDPNLFGSSNSGLRAGTV